MNKSRQPSNRHKDPRTQHLSRKDSGGGRLADGFSHFARKTSDLMGSPWMFCLAVVVVVVWALAGPAFGFSSTWQLVINTGTTIVTFLMVFLIQNTQNRDSKAIHLKLNALIDGLGDVREDMVDVEDATEAELEAAREEFQRIREAEMNGDTDRRRGGPRRGGPQRGRSPRNRR